MLTANRNRPEFGKKQEHTDYNGDDGGNQHGASADVFGSFSQRVKTRGRRVDGAFDSAIQAFGYQDQANCKGQDEPFCPVELEECSQRDSANRGDEMDLEMTFGCD
jgi:hypothetical protein